MRTTRLLLTAALLCACTDTAFAPPARDEAVRAEERRVAGLVEQAQRRGFSSAPGRCAVRVLRVEGDVTYAWAQCTWPGGGGASTPVRVIGTSVLLPGDGAGYAETVRRDFPDDIADAVLEDPGALRPDPA